MYLIYISFFFMLLLAISLLSYACIKNNRLKSLTFLASFVIFFSLGVYQYLRPVGLGDWLNHGRNHYGLMVQLNQLGGIDGIIQKIKAKLAKNPDDKKAWEMLAKLYHMQGDEVNAAVAERMANAN